MRHQGMYVAEEVHTCSGPAATSMKLRGVYNWPTWGLFMVPRSRPQCWLPGSQKAELPCEPPDPPLPDSERPIEA